jgi:cytochrome c peroxidase
MRPFAFLALAMFGGGCVDQPSSVEPKRPSHQTEIDGLLLAELAERGLDGHVEVTLEERLGRPIDAGLADMGRLLFFDPVLSLTGDNSCSGCHGPNASFNDSKSISIGVGNNGIVGPGRRGPHNQRRAPTVINSAFYPRLMWDSRFAAGSLDPFDNSREFHFPEPEGTSLSSADHLLVAQTFTPVANRVEMAGFGFAGGHDDMRSEVARRVDEIAGYRQRLADAFPEIATGEAVGYEHIAAALAEFMFTLVRADAPIDRYARGDSSALSERQKEGALLFFGRAMCGECHLTREHFNQMFSDFENHVIGVPQVVPPNGNVPFDGPGADEDFGVEKQTGLASDRYRFRTSPLRNVAYQPTFMHNGAFLCLEDAIRLHLEPMETARAYMTARLDPALQKLGPIEPVLSRLAPLIEAPPVLSDDEFDMVLEFVREGLTDPRAHPDALRHLVPATVPSGLPVHVFEFDVSGSNDCAN